MSATIQTIITCDGGLSCCLGNDWSADSYMYTAKEQRKRAKENLRWRFIGGKDFCPACFKRLKEIEKEHQQTP